MKKKSIRRAGAALAMVLKSQRELNDARAESGGEETPLVMEKARKREDWLVLMGLNHVFAGLEAYVGERFGGGLTQLVYKHAISTLQPAHPLKLEVDKPDEPESAS